MYYARMPELTTEEIPDLVPMRELTTEVKEMLDRPDSRLVGIPGPAGRGSAQKLVEHARERVAQLREEEGIEIDGGRYFTIHVLCLSDPDVRSRIGEGSQPGMTSIFLEGLIPDESSLAVHNSAAYAVLDASDYHAELERLALEDEDLRKQIEEARIIAREYPWSAWQALGPSDGRMTKSEEEALLPALGVVNGEAYLDRLLPLVHKHMDDLCAAEPHLPELARAEKALERANDELLGESYTAEVRLLQKAYDEDPAVREKLAYRPGSLPTPAEAAASSNEDEARKRVEVLKELGYFD